VSSASCRTPHDAPAWTPGDAIVVAGERYPIGVPVVLWNDPGGYDAHDPAPGGGFRPGRGLADGEEREQGLAELQQQVDQLVIHYDVCGTARACFEVLEQRGLSVHFLLDLDGTLYQTLDLCETAWHARQANARSVGVEIANIGAYAPGDPDSPLADWYVRDTQGVRIHLPERLGDGGVRTPGFVARPARPEPVRGVIQGRELEMYALTPEQQHALEHLAAGLCALFPRILPVAPRDAGGRVLDRVLTPDEFASFRGILGHYHVTEEKVDPGPAFDWEGFLARVRALVPSP
jgi:hypothetical protein